MSAVHLRICIGLLTCLVLAGCPQQPTGPTIASHVVIDRVRLMFIANQPPRDTLIAIWDRSNTEDMPQFSSDTIRLDTSKSYYLTIRTFDLLTGINEYEDVTRTIRSQEENHLLEVKSDPTTLVKLEALDKDGNGDPVGLSFDVDPTDIGNGTLTLNLNHWDLFNEKNTTTPSSEQDFIITFPLLNE